MYTHKIQIQLIVESDTGEVLVKSIFDEAKELERKMTAIEAQDTLDTLEANNWVAFNKPRYVLKQLVGYCKRYKKMLVIFDSITLFSTTLFSQCVLKQFMCCFW